MKVVFDTEGLKSDAGTNRRDTKKICGLEVLYLNIYLEIYMIFFLSCNQAFIFKIKFEFIPKIVYFLRFFQYKSTN